jgi:hypothetical protein
MLQEPQVTWRLSVLAGRQITCLRCHVVTVTVVTVTDRCNGRVLSTCHVIQPIMPLTLSGSAI